MINHPFEIHADDAYLIEIDPVSGSGAGFSDLDELGDLVVTAAAPHLSEFESAFDGKLEPFTGVTHGSSYIPEDYTGDLPILWSGGFAYRYENIGVFYGHVEDDKIRNLYLKLAPDAKDNPSLGSFVEALCAFGTKFHLKLRDTSAAETVWFFFSDEDWEKEQALAYFEGREANLEDIESEPSTVEPADEVEKGPAYDAQRRQHYRFAHKILLETVDKDAVDAVERMSSEHSSRFFLRQWVLAASHIENPDDMLLYEPTAMSAKINSKCKTVIISLPEPLEAAEAYFIAVVLWPESSSYNYYLLERAEAAMGRTYTMLCERTTRGHRSIGEGPAPDVRAFVQSIGRLVNKGIGMNG